MTLLLILAYAIVAFLQIRSLAAKRQWRDLAVFSVFMAASFAASLLLNLGVNLPNPVDAIQGLLEKLGLHY